MSSGGKEVRLGLGGVKVAQRRLGGLGRLRVNGGHATEVKN